MSRLANLFPWRRRRLERDLVREFEYHLERREAELQQGGLSESEAKRQAAIEFGGLVQAQEEVRDTWKWQWLDNLARDVRYALRSLVRSPGFTAAAVLSLMLGIGATAAIFALVDQVLVRSLPVVHPERLVHLDWKGASLSNVWGTGNLMSYPLCRDFQQQTQFFEAVFCRHPTEVILSTGDQHQSVPAEIVSGSFFPGLGIRPERGRLIDETDDVTPGAHPVVVLSYSYWKNTLGGAEDVVGRQVLMNNVPMIVIGIASSSFRGVDPLSPPAMWVPAMMKRAATPEWDRLLDRRAAWMHVFARLRPGVTADATMNGLQPWFKAVIEGESRLAGFPNVSSELRQNFLTSTVNAIPVAGGLSDRRITLKQPLTVLMAGTLLLALMASLNVASLLLARAASRTREVMTRLALGASRGRVMRQLLIESLLIALTGGVLGLAAAPMVSAAVAWLLPGQTDLAHPIDLRVFLFALALSLLTGAMCGLAPAIKAGRSSLLAKDRPVLSATGAIRLRKMIVVAQLAFALVVLIAAGLFVQTLVRLHAKDPGYERSRLVMVRVEPDAIGYSVADAPGLIEALLQRFRTLPIVEGAVVANSSLLTGGSPRRVLTVEAQTRIVTERPLPMMRVGPGFFATLGTDVVAGREFNTDDTRGLENGPYRSIVVNESFARRYFPGTSPVGRRVGFGNQPSTVAAIEIVGVVKDVSLRFVRDDVEPEHVFVPFASAGPLAGNGTIYVRVRSDPESAIPSIRTAITAVDSRLPVVPTGLNAQMDRALQSERMLAVLSAAFGIVALLLCVVGLYGVMSFVVARRGQEIGIRLALGATRAGTMWMILRDTAVMLAVGTIVALPTAFFLRRFVAAQLYGVTAFDGVTVLLASGLLVAVGFGAAMVPAWRAASVSPTEALRLE